MKKNQEVNEQKENVEKNGGDWEVAEQKVKIGTEWKSADQLKKSFFVELLIAIAFAVLTVYAFTLSIFLGVVILFITLFFVLTAMGSISALKSIDERIEFTPNINFKDKVNGLRKKVDVNASMRKRIVMTTEVETELPDAYNSIAVGSKIIVEKEKVSLDNGTFLGSIDKKDMTKLRAYLKENKDVTGFIGRVLNVKEKDGDYVEIEISAQVAPETVTPTPENK
ncbi:MULTISPECIES: hypothetical protein [unclassified Breznakia]|uniref:hypothetical protein n=1 Tax=unclassified Breznakia TaxID=2623764 RepID=UPI0024736AE7|nr:MULTISPECIES: hypothetical protein [unclassified Breznakia]MDH6367168.1 hypothetical protein [Breznakia sp. PH1-1]MDH6404412.1 hypothetical protein [Breznakia sp. PF1-11]MDH6412121.1 hypothetical protein [Breznakia sp. PFB1-11]MDH6414400.1 hypothetical protein [Breznakia sp. PFB1-14]MDH6416670.1 hypothetical protein [Breznakia sp. PFB1-4]